MRKSLVILIALTSFLFAGDDTPEPGAPPSKPAPDQQQGLIPATTTPVASDPFFPMPAYFKKRFENPPTKVELQKIVRVPDFVQSGKLELSLRDYLDLVLANHPDVSVQKLQVQVARNAIQRAYGVFDPLAIGRFTSTRAETPTSDALQGAATLNQLNQPLNLSYQQTLYNGTQFNVGFNSTKLSTNNSFALFNPSYTSNMQFGINQPLFRGRGAYITRMPISIAQTRVRGSEFNFENQVLNLLVQAELAYWAVVEARMSLRVQEQTLSLADAALKRSQKELELGAISSLEIYQPQANYANAEIFVTQARYRLAQAEDALRRQIGADLDPNIRTLPIELTESVNPPSEALNLDREQYVTRAIQRRPDLRSLSQNMAVDDLLIAQAGNALRPDIALNLNYSSFGRGGTFYERSNVFGQQQVVAIIPGGVGGALDQVFGFGFPTYGFGVTWRIPIKDRVASANLADAMVNKKIDAYRVRSLEQQIRLEVLNAINQAENSKASVELAKIARDLAQKRVEADQKRYELGTIPIFFVLASQNDLNTAEGNLVRESVNYRRNLLTLLQRTGDLFSERNIVIQP